MTATPQATPIFAAIYKDKKYQKTRQLLDRFSRFVCRPLFSAQTQGRLFAARDLMLQGHFDQADRPDGKPYINHPLEVALGVGLDLDCDQAEVLIAALLHDLVEDQAERAIALIGRERSSTEDSQAKALAALAERFGPRVAQLVARLTNPNFNQMIAQRQATGDDTPTEALKNQLYKDHVLELYTEDPQAFVVKFADLSANALQLDKLAAGQLKTHLREKYGPVILALIEHLEQLAAPRHPLYKAKAKLTEHLATVYQRDYADKSD